MAMVVFLYINGVILVAKLLHTVAISMPLKSLEVF